MKNSFTKKYKFYKGFLFTFSISLFLVFRSFAQQPTPVIFKPLTPPITDVYQFEKAGLIAISNKRELQFWDANTKAYFGYFGVLPPTAYNYSIRVVEYMPTLNTVAVVWEEYIIGENGKDTIYKDFLSVINLTTLLLAQPIEHNGMLAFIKYKYNKQIILPEFIFPEKIYQCYYNASINTFFTTDRNGTVSLYKNATFEKNISTGINQPKLFVTDSIGKFILMADGTTASVKRINIENKKKGKIADLQPVNSCLNSKLSYTDIIFSAEYNKDYNYMVLLDSINRIQLYNVSDHTIDKIPFAMPSGKIISVAFNFKDSAFLGIVEYDNSNCQRALFSTNLKTGLTNLFSGGNSLRITSSFYGSSPSSLRFLVSGVSEQEVNLANLSEKTNVFLVAPTESNLRFSGKWENGYLSLFDEGSNNFKLKVYESINDKTNLKYIQQIKCNMDEDFVAIEAMKKWYITLTKQKIVASTGASFFTIYDSVGKSLFKLPIVYGLQMMNVYPYEQQLFSKDGRFFMVKEYLSHITGFDSCRLRVFSTEKFQQIVDLRFKEITGGILMRSTAFLTDSTGKLYYTATTLNDKGKSVNFLYSYNLNEVTKPVLKYQLYIDPANEDQPFDIKTIRISKDEEIVLWTGSTNDNSTGTAMYYQAVRGTPLSNTKNQWGINMNIFPEVQNVLLLKDFVAVQLDDHIQFYKWMNTRFEYFLTLIPVYNEKLAEVSNLYVAFDKNPENFTYYEKTANDDCISFKFGNHSYKRNLFDLTFNRPDLILEQIPGSDEDFKILFRKAVLKRNERITNKLQDFKPELLPTITIKNTGYIGNKFRLTLGIKSKQPIVEIRTTVNGSTVKKSTYLSMEFGEIEYNIFETLSQGENTIEITAITKSGIEGLPLRVIQNHNRQQEKPGLHVLVVSVSEYDNDNANLPFAVKDGRDMSKLFGNQLSDTLFAYIKIDTLFNKAATNYAIQQWLKENKQTNPNDYVIVFYSGHGLLNKDKELQLATSSTLFDEAKNTIDFGKLLTAMDAIPARQKLILIDACHSGDLDKKNIVSTKENNKDTTSTIDSTSAKNVTLKFKSKNENAFEAMQKLFSFSEKGNGTIVFSASGGMQVAYEGAKYQNGYFTYALKEALLYNKANEGQEGMLLLNQLIKYTTKKVIEISGGRQTPNLRIAHPDINWRIK